MKIWIVTFGDGYEFSGQYIEAYTDETVAELRCLELNEAYEKHNNAGGYSVEESELDVKSPCLLPC